MRKTNMKRDPALRVALLEEQVRVWRERTLQAERRVKELTESTELLQAKVRELEDRRRRSLSGIKLQQLRAGTPPSGASGALSMQRARAAWGAGMPLWIERLAAACDATSQQRVATAIGMSPTTVNLTLGKRYPGRLDRLESRFVAWLKRETPGMSNP